MPNLDSILKSRGITLLTKVLLIKDMYVCESWTKESWVLKNWCFWTLMLERTFESPLDCKEIQPVNFKRNQSWIFIGRTDVEAETPILWPPDAKNWLLGKDPIAGEDWRQEEKGTMEDEMVGWYHQLDWHVWASSGSWCWTGKPGALQFMELLWIRHDWATEFFVLFCFS